jgi:hypothetical protein
VLLTQSQNFLAAVVFAVAVVQGGALGVAIHIFDGGDVAQFQVFFQFSRSHVAEAYVLDFAFFLQLKHSAQLLGQRPGTSAHQP